MKRFLALMLVLCLCLSFTGCKALDYGKASKHYKNEEYAEALHLYTSLDGYADSAAMAHLSWQKDCYRNAEKAFSSGNYREAMALYYSLEAYADSPVKAIESQYLLGLSLVDGAEYAEAIDLLLELGAYKDSAYNAHRAMHLWLKENLVELGGITLELDEAGQEKLLFVSTGGETVDVIYTRERQLLGLPNTSRFVLTIYPETQTLAFKASNTSTAASTILEEASGMVDGAAFPAAQSMNTLVFSQIITDPDGTVHTSGSTADAIILQSLLPEAAQIIAQNFGRLLELSGTDITPRQLGFLSIQ